MWLRWIPVLISAIAGCLAVTMLPRPVHVFINSSNFNSILHWAPHGPRDSVYDVEYQIYGEAWLSKAECYRTSQHRCDLTREFDQETNWYYARVKAVGQGGESEWTISERFCPLDKTVIGPPEVRWGVRARSIDIWLEPPTVHLRDTPRRSIEDIFSIVEYKVQLNEAATNKMVFVALNDNGNFTVESLEPSTEYCGTAKLLLERDIFLKESQTAEFCSQTEREWTLMIVLLVTASVLFGLMTTGIFCWMVHSYTTLHTALPHALDLNKILMKKHSSWKHSMAKPQEVTSQKDMFHFEQNILAEDIGLFKCLSCDTAGILRVGELGLATLLGPYAPQHHSMGQQTSGPTSSPCDLQTDRSSGLGDNEWSSPYRPQCSQRPSNTQASGEDGSRTRVEDDIPDANTGGSTNRDIPSTALQVAREGLLYKVDRRILSQRPEMDVPTLHTMEGKPRSLLSLRDDNKEADWKKQPLEVTLLPPLEEEVQSCPLLLHYRPRVRRDTLLSSLTGEDDASRVRGTGLDEEVPMTNVPPSYSHLSSPLLGESSVLSQLMPTWDDGCQAQLPTLPSPHRDWQQETLPTNTAAEASSLLAAWEIQVQVDE
ncbi:uncharacterized protein LOC116988286 isoform X2 [Amblyraja radiata]|uniref:uncharacterized protein LOC116988286 isoform X2 n=1 Tax=Amblyraja radiata TaxID=386614 RepID=UPI001403A665|nr:uncharacterized protein LOC116988286 isoform X2 [Amblyraja radiata]